ERGEISGRTAIIEKIGTAILYHVELSTGQMISIKAYEQLDIKEGDIVFITLPREKVRIFSKDGERLI
ncbi:MAG: TOBE domain-containing protein, partial [Candidatus Methanomethylicia archaeon]